jgi:hypothetical protein
VPFGSLLAIAGAPWLDSPKVADLNQRDTFVVGYLQASSLFASAELRARTVAAGINILGGVLIVDSPVTAVDIAGDNTTSGDAALFVYAKDAGGGNSTVELARATVGGFAATPVFTGRNNVQVPNAPVTDVAISKSNPSTSPYELAWVANDDLFTRTALRDGSVPGTSFGVDNAVRGLERGLVDVDGDGSTFLVAYQYDPAASGDSEIWLALLETDTLGAQVFYGYVPVDTTVGTKQMQPSIAWCGYKYLVLYSSQLLQGTYNFDLKGSERGFDGAACGPSFTLLGVNSSITRSNEFQPAIASKRSGGVASEEALLTFTEADDAPPFASDLVASRYQTLGPGGAITLHGSNCGVPGTIGANGLAAIGNTDFRITLSGAPPTAVPFLLWSLPGGESTCGPCSSSNTISAVFILPSAGTASYAFPIPCSHASYLGLTLQTQWALLRHRSEPVPELPRPRPVLHAAPAFHASASDPAPHRHAYSLPCSSAAAVRRLHPGHRRPPQHADPFRPRRTSRTRSARRVARDALGATNSATSRPSAQRTAARSHVPRMRRRLPASDRRSERAAHQLGAARPRQHRRPHARAW